MERGELLGPLLGEDGSLLVDGLADHVDDAAEGLGSDGHLDGLAGVVALLAADESVGGLHGDGADGVLSQVLGDLEDEALAGGFDFEGVEDLGKLLVELNIDNGSNDLSHLTHTGCGGGAAEGTGAIQGNKTSSTGSEHG
eukprot:928758_1